MQETKIYFLILLIGGVTGVLVLLLATQPTGRVGGAYVSEDSPRELPVAENRDTGPEPHQKGDYLNFEISARAALVKDLHSDFTFYEKDSRTPLPIASLTKLMTAVVVENQASLDDFVEITEKDVATEAYRAGLVVGEKISVKALLQAMLISSANDATLALAWHMGGSISKFVGEMNEEARRLGMTQTAFTNPVGFDDPGHYSTAADLSLLVQKFLSYPELVEIVKQKGAVIISLDGKYRHKLDTTNKLMLKYGDVVGLKTGYTAEAKGNLIVLVDESLDGALGSAEYYSIILGSANREAETEQVMSWVKQNFVWTR